MWPPLPNNNEASSYQNIYYFQFPHILKPNALTDYLDPPECEVPAHLQRVVLLPGGGQRLALGLLAGVVLHIVHVPHLGQGPGNMYCIIGGLVNIYGNMYCMSTIVSHLCVLFLALSMYSFLMSVLCFMYDVRSRYVR